MKRVLSVFSFAVLSMFAAVCTASAKSILKNASVPYTRTDNGGNGDNDILVEIYDGNYAYALVPDKIAECHTYEFTDLSDKIWMDEMEPRQDRW